MTDNQKAPLRLRMKIMREAIFDMTKKKIGIVMLAAGTFMFGYSVKGIGDSNEWKIVQNNFSEMQRSMAASCDARILQADKMAALRDSLVADQSTRLAEQGDQLRSQGILIHMIFDKQSHNQKVMDTIKKAATDARTSAVIAAKGATEKDREKINNAVAQQHPIKKDHK